MVLSQYERLGELRMSRQELVARRRALAQRLEAKEATMRQFNVVRLRCAKRSARLCSARFDSARKRNDSIKKKVRAFNQALLQTSAATSSSSSAAARKLKRSREKFNDEVERAHPKWRDQVERSRIYRLRRLENAKRVIQERRERRARFESEQLLLSTLREKEHEIQMLQAEETLETQRSGGSAFAQRYLPLSMTSITCRLRQIVDSRVILAGRRGACTCLQMLTRAIIFWSEKMRQRE